MAEYKNNEGWQASKRTLGLWKFIPMSSSDLVAFKMPPLFKKVSSLMWLYTAGFITVLILEIYATFFLAPQKGVPPMMIAIFVCTDFFIALLPNLFNGWILIAKNRKFVAEGFKQFERNNKGTMTDDNYKLRMNGEIDECNRKIFWNWLFKVFSIGLIAFSGFMKLFFFFQAYGAIYYTPDAYSVIICYSVGAILHMTCTGNVLFYRIFTRSLNSDRRMAQRAINPKNLTGNTIIHPVINSIETLFVNGDRTHNQKLISIDSSYAFETKGVLFDEELFDLIIQNNGTKEKLQTVAATGKELQLSFLD